MFERSVRASPFTSPSSSLSLPLRGAPASARDKLKKATTAPSNPSFTAICCTPLSREVVKLEATNRAVSITVAGLFVKSTTARFFSPPFSTTLFWFSSFVYTSPFKTSKAVVKLWLSTLYRCDDREAPLYNVVVEAVSAALSSLHPLRGGLDTAHSSVKERRWSTATSCMLAMTTNARFDTSSSSLSVISESSSGIPPHSASSFALAGHPLMKLPSAKHVCSFTSNTLDRRRGSKEAAMPASRSCDCAVGDPKQRLATAVSACMRVKRSSSCMLPSTDPSFGEERALAHSKLELAPVRSPSSAEFDSSPPSRPGRLS
mmetsp:Transcript_35200/g.91353  ORF Transcript_35200/g.91353 Transcript_35200/m.91353 type:complete len:317 (-) Transcript_35200:2414-3364(-)